jgi:nucleotide-binding universal stress UspA family protein
MYETMIWATDGSDGADAALEEAVRLAELTGGRIVAVHCDQRLNGWAKARPAHAEQDDRRSTIRRRVDELRSRGVDIDVLIRHSHGEAADVVASIADEIGADVIVCGTRGLGAFRGAFLGSFTQRLLHLASCPVLAVRGSDDVAAAPRENRAEVRV